MDIVLNTEARKMLFRKKAALRIHGPMQNLQVDSDLTGSALGTASGPAGIVVLPPLAISMSGLSFLEGFVKDGKTRPGVPDEAGGAANSEQ